MTKKKHRWSLDKVELEFYAIFPKIRLVFGKKRVSTRLPPKERTRTKKTVLAEITRISQTEKQRRNVVAETITEIARKERRLAIRGGRYEDAILASIIEHYANEYAVRRRTPSIALSAATGTGQGLTTGVGIVGYGFPQLAFGTGIRLYFISTGKRLSMSGATAVSTYGKSFQLGSPPAGTASVDSNGNFQAFFDVPELPFGTYNVFVTYTSSGGSLTLSSAISFSIVPYLDVRLANEAGDAAVVPTSRFAHLGQWVRIKVYGFGASEEVTITGLPVAADTAVNLTTNSLGTCSKEVFAHVVGETTGGSKTVTAVGSTSGATATRSFTIIE